MHENCELSLLKLYAWAIKITYKIRIYVMAEARREPLREGLKLVSDRLLLVLSRLGLFEKNTDEI